MYWPLFSLMLASGAPPEDTVDSIVQETAEIDRNKEIYVAPPTIHDELLQDFGPYISSLVVASSGANSHWVKRSGRAEQVSIFDNYTIELYYDNCNYDQPLKCGFQNHHWVLITDIFTTQNFATVVIKLYDESAQLIASTSRSSYSVEKCSPQVTETTINQTGLLGQSRTEVTEKRPDRCIVLKPSILDKDIKQAVTTLFASIHPI